ncbi:hypothetical protein CR513_62250, partial [Mucuna pruriens]
NSGYPAVLVRGSAAPFYYLGLTTMVEDEGGRLFQLNPEPLHMMSRISQNTPYEVWAILPLELASGFLKLDGEMEAFIMCLLFVERRNEKLKGVKYYDLCGLLAGNFGTVIFHGDELRQTTQEADSAVSTSALTSGTGGRLADSEIESQKVGLTSTASFRGSTATNTIKSSLPYVSNSTEQSLKPKGSHQAQAGIGTDIGKSLLRSETVSRKAFALQDKLWSIYAAGNTVPIPFLRATDISPIALLSDNVLGGLQQDTSGTGTVEALQELFSGDGQSKKGRRGLNEQMPLPPSIYQRLTSSSTLMNLAQALAYHKMCYEDMPLQELQATQEQRTIQNLSDTLRTILRLCMVASTVRSTPHSTTHAV